MRAGKIYCPKCQWLPQPSDQWMCEPACGCLWNTFETDGVCPWCGKNWKTTQCFACHKWSPHADWYHEFAAGERPRSEILTVAE